MSIGTLFVLVFLILVSIYSYYYVQQSKLVIPVINEVNSNFTSTVTTIKPTETYTTPLLFPNIRWAKMPLSVYVIAENCTSNEIQDVADAEKIWEEKTNGLISFTDASSPSADVIVDCLSNSSSIREGRHIIRKVGEGGPSSVYDTGLFNLTTRGKIYLFASNYGCNKPIIALHEMGHVLGLDHSDNPDSVMYAYEECNQDITPEIVSTLQSLYSLPPKPDLYFSDASASQKNYYLFINMTIKNEGLITSQPTSVSIFINGNEVKSVSVDPIKPAEGYVYTLSNVFVSSQVLDLKLVIDPQNTTDELFKTNDILWLIPTK